MITFHEKWMTKLLQWVSGTKHPETPVVVFKNVWEYDRVRKILKRRCAVCDYVLSSDEKNVRELMIVCGREDCNCKMWGARAHEVCLACYEMWHAIYFNTGLKDVNYFKKIDEQEERSKNDPKKRDRLGL